MRKQDIKDIKLGLRQLTFGFEKNVLKEQDLIMSCIKKQTEKNGHVILDEFVQYVKELHDLSEFEILQYIFWFAQDLKIHLRIDGKNLEPHKVKKVLLKSTEQSVKIITNKSVDDSVFQDVKSFHQKLSGEKSLDDYDDQYDFARLLAKEIRDWESCLKSYRYTAQKPYFPGKKEIDDGLYFIKTISAKLDSFSLINAFYNNKEQILKLVDDVKTISGFYTKHIDIWETLIQSVEEFSENLPELKKDSGIAAGFDRLTQILSSSRPYDMIMEVGELLKNVKAYNDKIEENKTKQCRIAALSKVDNMIERMKVHLDAHKTGQDLRNKSLYSLRIINKSISKAKNIKRIDIYINEAEDKFDTFWEEIEKNSES
jgi:hypothetical protein